jgi:DNA-binding MarR family transcriptional regulator
MKKLKIEKFFNESATISLVTNGLRIQKEINSSLAKFGLNLNQALIMLAIFFEPEKTIRSYELMNLIPTTKGNISHCTSFLEEQNHIMRKNVEGDLRGYEFSLTPKGSKLTISLIKFFDSVEAECDKKFSAVRLKEFISICEKI